MKNKTRLWLCLALAISSQAALSQDYPTCSNASSDPDGDGWGWENSQSCIVSSSTTGDEPCDWYGTNFPICDSTTSGWGWENSQSCIAYSTCADAGGIGGTPPTPEPTAAPTPEPTTAPTPQPTPQPSSAPSSQCNWYGTNYPLCNSTASGWGWEDNQSCIAYSTCADAGGINNNPTPVPTATPSPTQEPGNPDYPTCANASSDPDGDGYGWENNQTCIIDSNPPPPQNGSLSLSNPNASPEAVSLFRYINAIYGTKTLTGQQESTWASGGARHELNYLQEHTGRLPAVLGLDYIAPNDYSGVDNRAASWYKDEGGIPSICWHWGAPDIGTGYENSKQYFDLPAALIDGTSQNQAMMRDMDTIASHLAVLRDQNVPVLWRPLHEFSGTWFWWGMHGSENFKALWIKMYNYFTYEKGLDNLIWVLGYTGEPNGNYYPGDAYVDIAGADTYANNNGALKGLYNEVASIVGSTRPIALHENGPIPDPALVLSEGANWSWFLTWHTDWLTNESNNSRAWLNYTYNHEHYITKDELPDLQNY